MTKYLFINKTNDVFFLNIFYLTHYAYSVIELLFPTVVLFSLMITKTKTFGSKNRTVFHNETKTKLND